MRALIAALFLLIAKITLAQDVDDKPVQINGAVVNAATGEPVPGALAILNPGARGVPGVPRPFGVPAPAPPQRAVTDASGKFSFVGSTGQSSVVQVSHRGYRAENDSDVANVDFDSDNSSALTVKLVPLSAIEGRIVNQDGEPLPALTVEAIRVRIRNGRREARTFATKTTNDLGEYRLWYLSPGSYYLKVVGRRSMSYAINGVPQPSLSEEAYGPMYYPSAGNRDTAQILKVGAGATVHADFTLEGRRAYRITGSLGKLSANARVELRLLRGDEPVGNRAGVNSTSGEFGIFDVTPGSYTLQAFANDAGRMLFGEASVVVGERDVSRVVLALNAGVDIPGSVRVSGSLRRTLSLTATATDVDRLPPSYSSTLSATSNREGEFTLKNMLPGHYELQIGPVFQEYVQAVTADGVDVLGKGLTVGSAAPALVIEMAPATGEIRGRIDGLRPGESALAVLACEGKIVQSSSIFPAQEGLVVMRNLPPGQYTLYAWRNSQEIEYQNPAVLEALSGYAVAFSIPGDDKQEVKLKLIPAEVQ